ncbi:hypothetical protein HN011_005402 [Eciton burchellii]|nr:hypothetical protein HN011_005402 [Eciton burchellii]
MQIEGYNPQLSNIAFLPSIRGTAVNIVTNGSVNECPRKPTTSCVTYCHESIHRSQEWTRMDIKNDTRLLKDRRSNVRGVIHYCVYGLSTSVFTLHTKRCEY